MITGPIVTPGSSPPPMRIFRASSTSRAFMASYASPTASTTELARQRSPAQPKQDSVETCAARARSASGITSTKFLAPPSACTRFPFSAERR